MRRGSSAACKDVDSRPSAIGTGLISGGAGGWPTGLQYVNFVHAFSSMSFPERLVWNRSVNVPANFISSYNKSDVAVDDQGVITFDDLKTDAARKEAIAILIESLPAVSVIQVRSLVAESAGTKPMLTPCVHCLKQKGLMKSRKLEETSPATPKGMCISNHRRGPALTSHIFLQGAWRILRWIVASNSSYIKQVSPAERITSISSSEYRQFRFVAGSPEHEVAFGESLKAAQERSPHTKSYPTIFAWHGSASRNWHSILRTVSIVYSAFNQYECSILPEDRE